MKLKNIFIQTFFMAGGAIMLSSCNDFLDREPLASVTPKEYFQTVDHLASYTISQYNGLFSTHGGFSAGTLNNDKNTDNMVAGGYSASYFEKGQWKVPNNDGDNWNFSRIRYCNYFFEQVLPKYEAGSISGSEADIKHYIGEMYFIRAWTYFQKLQMFGDYPIITEVLPDQKEILMEKSVRQPRNMVARFILEDLDKAAEYMHEQGFNNNNRLNKACALLIKSRVALYEATFEKYHKGTGRVPGDDTWPGKSVHANFFLDVASEINFFLDQAMDAAQQVADAITLTSNSGLINPESADAINGWNDYFEMFAAEDMSKYSEVLFWKDYLRSADISITHGTPAYIYSGGNNGMLKSYVDCFLMENGLPWYATNTYQGDVTIMKVKANRDLRLQLFLLGENDMLPSNYDGDGLLHEFEQPNLIPAETQIRDQTGYRIRKCLTYDHTQIYSGQSQATTGCIVFRGVEAHLNYLEAYYLKNGNISGKAADYWKAIRQRAGVNTNYQATIDATDLTQETDLAKYSGDKTVDATLYNIRRERRCEFIGEGMRWDDLIRWRAMDQMITNKFIPEGYNFWEEAYKTFDPGTDNSIIDDPDNAKANISSRTISKYLRPFSIVRKNNPAFDGFTWAKANYLRPVPIREMELLSLDEKVETSVLYQNPYWPTVSNGVAIE